MYPAGMPSNAEELDGLQKARTRRAKNTGWIGVVALLCGVPPLINSLGNPRLAGLHGPDVLRLFAVGWCFGIGATLLAITFIRRRN